MNRITLRNTILGTLLVGLVLVAGCFTSKYTIVNPASAKVDTAFVGNWNSDSFDSTGREAGLIIRNIDDKMYYAEWKMKGDNNSLVRGVGYITQVKGATFTQLRGLEEDGKIDDEWLIARLELSGNTLKIRQLGEDFMKKQNIDSSDKLRKVLEDNVSNEAMYAKDEMITATRVTK
jgi:hypothetical protein